MGVAARREDSPRASPAALDADSRIPLYHQLYLLLRDRVQRGGFAVGDLVPGEAELAGRHGVSRITARRALNELAATGLVVRERGRGTRVVVGGADAAMSASIEGWLENASRMGAATRARVLEFDYRAADDDVINALKLPAGATIQRAVRVRLLDGAPMSWLLTCVPEDIGRGYTRAQLEDVALLQLLERGGVEVSRAYQSISATLADVEVAAALDVPVGAPLLEVRRVVHDAGGRPVEYIRVLYRPDRYRFDMTMQRAAPDDAIRWSASDPDRS